MASKLVMNHQITGEPNVHEILRFQKEGNIWERLIYLK